MGSVDHVQILFKRYNNSFYVPVNAFWPWQKQYSNFQFLTFPIGYTGGLRWLWGLKTQLQNFFLKGIFVQEGSSGTRFDHGQFEIKTFPIYAPPYCTVSNTARITERTLKLSFYKINTSIFVSAAQKSLPYWSFSRPSLSSFCLKYSLRRESICDT